MGNNLNREREAEGRRLEALKIQYDHLKHLSTLGGATALVELAIYEVVEVNLGALSISLVSLAVCVGGSLFTMGPARIAIETGQSPGTPEAYLTGAYLAGLGFFVLPALGLSLELSIVLLLLAFVSLVVVSEWQIRRAR